MATDSSRKSIFEWNNVKWNLINLLQQKDEFFQVFNDLFWLKYLKKSTIRKSDKIDCEGLTTKEKFSKLCKI